MALKNDETISVLGKRLYGLMDEKHIGSPKDLAKILYGLELVHVNTRENFNSPERDRDNAIQSIEKKIVRHIKSGMLSDNQGEYLIAYCKYFVCSADYILGFTEIRTPNIEARRICELTGLPEEAILELIKLNQEELRPVPGCWAMLLKSKLFHSLPEDIIAMGKELSQIYLGEAEVHALEWEREQVKGLNNPVQLRDLMEVSLEMDLNDINYAIGRKREEVESRRSAFYGRLSKVSRNLEETIEDDLKTRFASIRTSLIEKRMKDAKETYSEVMALAHIKQE